MADIKPILIPRREQFTANKAGIFTRQVVDFLYELAKRSNGDTTEGNDATLLPIANYVSGSLNSLGAQIDNSNKQERNLESLILMAIDSIGLLNAEVRDIRKQLDDIRNTFPWQ